MTTVIHHKDRSKIFPNNEVYIGRPSKWGNPFTHLKSTTQAKYRVDTREQAIEAYREWITNGDGKYLLKDLHELKDKILVCWCKPQSCHGDILIELLNSNDDDKIINHPNK